MRRAFAVGIVALGLLAVQGLNAYANYVPVLPADYSSLRSSAAGGGITASGDWGTGNLTISWVIVPPAVSASHYWEYTYTVTQSPGVPEDLLSHWLLEVSEVSPDDPDLGPLIIGGSTNFEYEGPKTWTAYFGGNPDLPVNLYAISLDPTSDLVFSFWSARRPVWGDFYFKDGSHATAWNTAIGTEPSSTPFTNWIAVPDTERGGSDGQIPEPSSLLLLVLGGCGVLVSRLRRKP